MCNFKTFVRTRATRSSKEKYSEYGYLTGELAEAAAEVLGHALNEDR